MKKFVKKGVHFVRTWILVILGLGIVVAGIVLVWASTLKIPDFQSFDERKIEKSTKIYDRTGEVLLYDIHQDYKRTVISGADMGVNIKNATVAIEDSAFYQHKGIRVKSIIRAVWANVFDLKRTQGGSTITQQVIKNSLLTKDKTLTRKLKEWFLAVKLERVMGKDEILALYLNENPYGGSMYGIEEASQTFFKKKPADLTLAEAAYLAAIPNAPTYYSPFGKNKDKLDARKNLVLSRMNELGFISAEEFEKAKTEVVTFQPAETLGIKAPHFVFFIRDYLEQKYGADMVDYGGLKVTTTLDYKLQEKAETVAKENALKNEKDFNAKNTAVVILDPKTGQILSMVGSRNYFDKEIDGQFNVATAYRQPGSSFKPIVYATAFMEGYTPESILYDVPTEFNPGCNAYGKATGGTSQKNCYMPDNYNADIRGPMQLRDALGQSINIPAVKLLYLVGIADALKTAKDMGIRTLTNPERYGLTLVLGGGEVSVLDMAGAYGVFANSGMREKTQGILKLENSEGIILEEYQKEEAQVIPRNVALTISDILSDNEARTPTFGANSTLNVGPNVAVKTGTTNLNKDAWMIGYSTSAVVAVWSGNNENTSMKKGSTVSGPTFNALMREALKLYPADNFEPPMPAENYDSLKPILRGKWLGGQSFMIDSISGKLATEFTPKETQVEKIITNVHDILHWVNKDDPLGPSPTNPEKDSQYRNWETAVQNWWSGHSGQYPVITVSQIPTGYDDVHTLASKPIPTIVSPTLGTTYPKSQPITVSVTSTGPNVLKKIDVFVNNIYVGSSSISPNSFTFTPEEVDGITDTNELRVLVHDIQYNNAEVTSTFMVTL
jgi:penicillin-binding protein 1C